MDKKGNLLCSLKRQLLALKHKLERIERHRESNYDNHYKSKNYRSPSHSPRFDSANLDSSYLGKGIKKFYQSGHQFKNLTQLIQQKAQSDRKPIFSAQRKAENQRTRMNFSQQLQKSKPRSMSPNPLTGDGYSQKKLGKRRDYNPKRQVQIRPCNKKHFELYY